ncbi:MAG: hypothetical protein RLP44_29740 [Aggregatilineales bacterium]
MTSFDTLNTYVTDANATLDDLQALLADLRGYGVVQFEETTTIGDAGTFMIPVKLTLCAEALGAAVTVDINVTAPPSVNYTLNTPTLTFPAGSQNGAIQHVEIAVASFGEDDSLTVTLSNLTGQGTLGANASYLINLVPITSCDLLLTFDGDWETGNGYTAELMTWEDILPLLVNPHTPPAGALTSISTSDGNPYPSIASAASFEYRNGDYRGKAAGVRITFDYPVTVTQVSFSTKSIGLTTHIAIVYDDTNTVVATLTHSNTSGFRPNLHSLNTTTTSLLFYIGVGSSTKSQVNGTTLFMDSVEVDYQGFCT